MPWSKTSFRPTALPESILDDYEAFDDDESNTADGENVVAIDTTTTDDAYQAMSTADKKSPLSVKHSLATEDAKMSTLTPPTDVEEHGDDGVGTRHSKLALVDQSASSHTDMTMENIASQTDDGSRCKEGMDRFGAKDGKGTGLTEGIAKVAVKVGNGQQHAAAPTLGKAATSGPRTTASTRNRLGVMRKRTARSHDLEPQSTEGTKKARFQDDVE